MDVDAFLNRWSTAPASERANSQPFLLELCSLLGVDKPHTGNAGAYCFERTVKRHQPDGSKRSDGRIDLYKEGCFVLESKQKTEKERTNDKAFSLGMIQAKQQAEEYAKFLTEWPPFLVVVDVGHAIEIFADFSDTGKRYLPFTQHKAFQGHRLQLNQLRDDGVRALLKRIWTDPRSLDPSIVSQAVTTRVAAHLADISRSLEKQGHDPEHVSSFLMRCIFTMFAEDVRLLPPKSFTKKLEHWMQHPHKFAGQLQKLWQEMDTGGESLAFEEKILRFNGGLFKDTTTFQLNQEQVGLLLDAAKQDWTEVEPAIFGTLLERALNPRERHKLGAHFTPRAYVERLVFPTVIEPLREDWDRVKVAVVARLSRLDTLKSEKARADARAAARKELLDFHHVLCTTRVLDPACGTGNFLYVAMEYMKRLEADVLDLLAQIEGTHRLALLSSSSEAHRETVDPHQFLGIELNARAAVIAEMVLWIGYLQWHYRTLLASSGTATVGWHEPVLRQFDNIQNRDALLAWDTIEQDTDNQGNPRTRWDGVSTKPHPVTRELVPDESKSVPIYRYVNPRKAAWPTVEFIVGNPPFLGKLHLQQDLGDGYVDALRGVYDTHVPGGADLVMYWWAKSARLASNRSIRRFGFVTTNSITQPFNRRVLSPFIENNELHLRLAIPDHPWVESSDGAAVRIAMTVGVPGVGEGEVESIATERVNGSIVDVTFNRRRGVIHSDLSVGANVTATRPLKANAGLASMGPSVGSRGFVVDAATRQRLLDADQLPSHVIPPLRNGKDLVSRSRDVYVINVAGLSETDLRTTAPATYQHLALTVRPERIANRDARLAANWWRFRRANDVWRALREGLQEVVVTVETAKHRVFFVLPQATIAEHGTITFGFSDRWLFGVLSSRVHVAWALGVGGTLEDRPRYNKTLCFDTFPFPVASQEQQQRIRALATALEAHRARQQQQHPDVTITGMYNVLNKLRSGEALTQKEHVIHEQALVTVLKQLHDDLDQAVLNAYGWPVDLTDEQVVERLVSLNHERLAEELRGDVRWIRPEYQIPLLQTLAPASGVLVDDDVDDDEQEGATNQVRAPAPTIRPWPTSWPARVGAIDDVLRADGGTTVDSLSSRFTKANKADVKDLLDALCGFGRAEQVEPGVYMAVG